MKHYETAINGQPTKSADSTVAIAILLISLTNSEQEIDGEALDFMISSCCSVGQLVLCGLKTVKQQIKFKKLLMPLAVQPSTPVTYVAGTVATGKSKLGKLSREELKELTTEQRRMYLIT